MTEFGAPARGYFNVHHEDWLGRWTTETAGHGALQLKSCLSLEQTVDTPTEGVSTTLANLGILDYNPVLVRLNLPANREKPCKRKVWQYNKANYWEMQEIISALTSRKSYLRRILGSYVTRSLKPSRM